MHVKKGDLVQVLSGADKGKQGNVLRVDYKNNRVKVEGIRVVSRHRKPSGNEPGRIEKREAFIPSCKVLPIDPESGKPTRVRMQVIDGKKVRVAQKSGAVLGQKS